LNGISSSFNDDDFAAATAGQDRCAAANSTKSRLPGVAGTAQIEVGEDEDGDDEDGEDEGVEGEGVEATRAPALPSGSSAADEGDGCAGEGSGGLDKVSATTLSTPATCLMSVVNSAT
jgi:hypothetical protein